MQTDDAYSSGHLVLSHFGTCKCSNIETVLSWTCLVSGLLSFEHPSVLLFLLRARYLSNRSRTPSRCLTVLVNIIRSGNSTLLDIMERQLCMKEYDSGYWFISIRDILEKYRFPPPQEKKEDIWLMSYDKNSYTSRNVKRAKRQHKQCHKKVRLHSGCGQTGRSVGVITATQLALLTGLRVQPSHFSQQPCNQKDTHLKICK